MAAALIARCWLPGLPKKSQIERQKPSVSSVD
jgi:hypothetical protein